MSSFAINTKSEAVAAAQGAVKVASTVFFGMKEKNGSNKFLVLNLIDAFHKPPSAISSEYISVVFAAASVLNVTYPSIGSLSEKTGAVAKGAIANFVEKGSQTSKDMQMYTSAAMDSEEKVRNAVNGCRNDIFDIANHVNSFIARAKSAGFIPKENPFLKIASFNINRPGFSPVEITEDQSLQLIKDIKIYLQLIEEEASGRINIEAQNSSQLSSATLSLSGFGGNADTSISLSNFLLNADDVKKQKAEEALSMFDFSKRLPKILFTAEWAPSGETKGTIVGWKKIFDASGYIVKRTSLFSGEVVMYAFTNDEMKADTDKLFEYVNTWILSFYDNIDPKSIVFFIDTNISVDCYYHYELQAYQLQNVLQGSLFNVDTSPARISTLQKSDIRNQLEKLDPDFIAQVIARNAAGSAGSKSSSALSDTISPYPVLSHVLLGDSKYDWLLAALNIRQSVNRGDSKETTRNYSYLSAQLDFILSQASAGNFLLPKNNNVSEIMNRITDAIGKYGVTQVIEDILQETGALYFFDGKDPKNNVLFGSVDYIGRFADKLSVNYDSNKASSGLVAVVAAAIDPETATLDLRTLATNLPMLVSGEFVSTKESLSNASVTTELEIPTRDKSSSNTEFLSKLGALDNGVVDLTTADGVGTFMRALRIMSDIGSSRGSPIVTSFDDFVPDVIEPKTLADAKSNLPVAGDGKAVVIKTTTATSSQEVSRAIVSKSKERKT